MAYNTITNYAGNGTTTDYSIPFAYVKKADVTVIRQNGSVSFTYLSSNVIRLSAPLAVGDVLTITRKTDVSTSAVTFSNGSVQTAEQFNTAFTQTLFSAQEASDLVTRGFYKNTFGQFDSLNARIINVADPVSALDAVNKQYFDGTLLPQLQAQATAAAASASTATTQASSATTSAATATTKASAATTSATAAASSATAAASSATAASGSASAASTSATASASSASSAASAVSTAATSATTATTKASEASASASAAATSASNASTSATNAAASATTATTQATAAATSATGAATSATSAASSLDSFKKQYLGASATAPTTRYNASPLQTGDLYFDTVLNVMKVYASTLWVNASSSVNGTSARFRYVATASQTTFSGSDSNSKTLAYDPGFIDVYLNGVRLDSTAFTATSGTSVVLGTGATVGAVLNIVAYGTFVVNNLTSSSVTTALGYTPYNATNPNGYITISSVSGSYQPLDAELTAIAALAPTASNFIVGDGTTWTSATPASARTALGLVIGTNVQAYDADLAAIAALTPTANNFIVGSGTAWGLATPTAVKTALGLVIGTDVQAYNANLTSFAGKTAPTGAVVGTTDTQTLTNKTLTGLTETVFNITDGASVDINPANGSYQTWTLGANRTPTATSFAAGQSVTLMIADGTAFAITWTTLGVTWVGGTAPTLPTTTWALILLWKVGSVIYGSYLGTVA